VKTMKVPFQALQACGDIIIAAKGCSLHTFNLRDGTHLSSWICPGAEKSTSKDEHPGANNDTSAVASEPVELSAKEEENGPPTKRRKVDSEGEDETPERVSPAEAEGEKEEKTPGKSKDRKKKSYPSDNGQEALLIQCVNVTSDGKHIVAVTNTDKAIWVLEHDGHGRLKQLSHRYDILLSADFDMTSLTVDQELCPSGHALW
jgi:tRNA (guanine-N(7)-)-methyltransferase subunit TRM82